MYYIKLMSTLGIRKSILFEKIVPETILDSKTAIDCSQKRLSLQDALNTNNMNQARKYCEEYRTAFIKVLENIEAQRANTVLLEQPQFEWDWNSGSYMSSCWIWEQLMSNAVSYDIYMASAMKSMSSKEYKEASKYFHKAGEYVQTIIEKVLPTWTWKEDASIHMTFEKFWVSKIYFIYSMKDLCTIQHAMNGKGISGQNALRLLERIQSYNDLSFSKWANADNEALMNWARVGRALFLAQTAAEREEFGQAIGTVRAWEPILDQLRDRNHMNIVMETLVSSLKNITDSLDEWETSNGHVHFKVIEEIELPDIKEMEEITSKINSL